MKSRHKDSVLIRNISFLTIIIIVAVLIYSQYGFYDKLARDCATPLYSGQRMAEGVPPLVSMFDNKSPLTSMVAGLGVIISKYLSSDDVYTVRFIFFIISCLTVVSIYLLGSILFQSRRIGLFAALTFLGFFTFLMFAASGPRYKTLVVLFQTLSLLFTSRKKWFWAGLFGSLSFLTWQPTIIFPLVTLFLSITSSSREKRIQAISKTLFGIALPIIAITAYFSYNKSLHKLIDGTILFNIRYLDRGKPFTLYYRQILKIIYRCYSTMVYPIFIGFLMIPFFYLWRSRINNSSIDTLTKDAFSPILLSFPAISFWSLIDFQGGADFFIFLPYIAIGFSKFLDIAIQKSDDITFSKTLSRFLTIGLCIILIAVPFFLARFTRTTELYDQRKAAFSIEERFGKDIRLLSIGVPELLVLLHRVNPTPFVFVIAGIDRYIQAKYPGGFDGWLQELKMYDPDIIAYGKTRGKKSNIEKLENWIESKYHMEKIGPWTIYVRNTK